MTPEQKATVDAMTQEQMARLWRFAPSGAPYFDGSELSRYFCDRFKSLGMFTPAISKAIGWDAS